MKRIPKRFQILGHTITVRILNSHQWDELATKYDFEDAVGYFSPSDQLVLIKRQAQSLMLHTFYHELVHVVLDTMNNKLSNDEGFVDNFAGHLSQIMGTAS